jgi:Leu/Phe-tRNA-protein transferase
MVRTSSTYATEESEDEVDAEEHWVPYVSSQEPDSADDYLPDYLRRLVLHSHGDFFQTPCFEERLVAHLMAEGFLPISTNYLLLPKLHARRCVIPTGRLHIAKSAKKRSKKYSFSINQAFSAVVEGCHAQHGISWLYPKIVAAFYQLFRKGTTGTLARVHDDSSGEDAWGISVVRLYSMEVWNASSGQLVAGELGYTVGSIYTSLTGFSAEDGAGSVQLAALGALLQHLGVTMWDLGMFMDYKERLGAIEMPRPEFVAHVHRVRISHSSLLLHLNDFPCTDDRPNCKDIITAGSTRTTSHTQEQPLVAKKNHPRTSSTRTDIPSEEKLGRKTRKGEKRQKGTSK